MTATLYSLAPENRFNYNSIRITDCIIAIVDYFRVFLRVIFLDE